MLLTSVLVIACSGDSGTFIMQTVPGEDGVPSKVYAVGLVYASSWANDLKRGQSDSVAYAIPLSKVIAYDRGALSLPDLTVC